MPEQTDPSYDRARDLAETALEEYAKGDKKKGDALADQAVQTDRRAVGDVVNEIDEDAQTTGRA
jgi:hypothetical protein